MSDALERIRRLLALASDRRAALEEAKIGGRRLALMLRAHRAELRLPGIGTLVLDPTTDQWDLRREASTVLSDSGPGGTGATWRVDLSGLRGSTRYAPRVDIHEQMRQAIELEQRRRQAMAQRAAEIEQLRQAQAAQDARMWHELRQTAERLKRERDAAMDPNDPSIVWTTTYFCTECGAEYTNAHTCGGPT